MVSILVTGANGQLGSELKKVSGKFPGLAFQFTDIEELDITDPQAVNDFLNTNKIQFLVNCAAYTAVDRAEDEPLLANRLNAEAVAILAGASVKHDIRLIHISTDYVFNGENNRPYPENDPVDPQTVYGRSKLAGETAVQKTGRGTVIRTSWLYSVFGNNFVKTILRLSKEKERLSVVFDQTGSPTNARDLAVAILKMIHKDQKDGRDTGYKVYHYANNGICSWFEFAQAIVRQAGSNCKVEPIAAVDYPTIAVRPRYSVLGKTNLLNDYQIEIPHWKDSLKVCIEELMK